MKTCKYGCGKMKEGGKVATVKKMAKGGTAKKYAMGGSTIVGMPKYSNNPRSDAGRMLKAGGATSNKKFAALAPPYDKATFADRIAGAKKNARKK